MDFGFLLNDREFSIAGIEVRKLPSFNDVVESFYDNVEVRDGWIYLSTIEGYETKPFRTT